VGSAQWREEKALLQHGSILIENDQSSLSFFAAQGADAENESLPAPATLSELMGRVPPAAQVASAMFDAVRDLEDADATELAEADVRPQTLAHIAHFLDEGWTWRR
jgi:lipoate-protein ligase A